MVTITTDDTTVERLRDHQVRRVTGSATVVVGLTGLIVTVSPGGPASGTARLLALLIGASAFVVALVWFRDRPISRRAVMAFAVYAEIGITASALLAQDRALGQTLGIGLAVVGTYGIFYFSPRLLLGFGLVNAALLVALALLAAAQDPGDVAGTVSRLIVGLVVAAIFPFYIQRYVRLINLVAARRLVLAHHDPLTGLLNRRGLDVQLRALIGDTADGAAAPLHTGAVRLAVLDLDAFKAVNDQHGHAAGDRVLTSLARRLTQHVGGDGLVARTGGEEFAVVVAGRSSTHDRASAASAGELLLATVHRPDDDVPVTASIGTALARGPVDDDVLQQLLADADAAMYCAKRAGGNRSVLAETVSAPTPDAGGEPVVGR